VIFDSSRSISKMPVNELRTDSSESCRSSQLTDGVVAIVDFLGMD
jgi:hypothetical protein